jgi:hypothetical protein
MELVLMLPEDDEKQRSGVEVGVDIDDKVR